MSADHDEREQRAEQGRALFATLIHAFNEHAKILQATGTQQERVARSLEKLVQQLEVGLEQQRLTIQRQREQMDYSAALQGQIRVLCELIAEHGVELPELPQQPPGFNGPLGALGQHLVNGIFNQRYPGM